ncbi:MAG TPA: efflux RND transporter permease subunit [Gemmatimonadaceae bacterium]|nr:efflux RND transporter permease subunit [Gemmatimonadaceae bacterium]
MKLYDLLGAQRRFIYLVIAMVSAAGIWAGFHLPSAIYPELTFPRITVVAQGSALGARQVVFALTRPIEEAISIIPGVQRVRSKSIRGASQIDISFAPNTDMVYALQLVNTRVNEIRGTLPPELEIEIERLTPSVFPILSYNLIGGDAATLYDIARYQIRPVFSRVPGVGRVDVQGTDVREIEVIVDPARLSAQSISYDDVANAIKQATSVDAVGRVAEDYQQYLIVTDQEAHTVEDIANVVVSTPSGSSIRVSDLGSVMLGTEDHTRIIAGDGRPAATLNITRQIGGNTVTIADSIAGLVKTITHTLPPGVRIEPVYDQATLVKDAVTSVRDAMLIGAALAIIVLLLFLRHGVITAISATSIPLTLAITVFFMSLVGQTFNLMTLGAMAIAIGLVIDDAVVITENIARHLAITPDDRQRAIREAVQELIWPVTTSTITTVVVFLPLGLLQGVVGQFFIALSVTLTIAVLVSLVLALTIIPLLSAQFVKHRDEGAKVDWLADRYEKTLAIVLRHPSWVITAAVVLVALGVVAQQRVASGFLPEMDEGAYVFDYFTPGGTALAETDREVRIAERIMAATPEIEATSRRTGTELGVFATEQNRGDLVARLVPRSKRDRTVDEVIDDVRAKVQRAVPRLHIDFVQILSDVINDLAGAARPIEIKLFGEQLESLEAYAKALEPDMTKVDGVEDFYNGVSEPSPELMLRISGAEANRIGMTPQQVGADVSGSILGVVGGEIRTQDRAIAVRVRAPDTVRFDPLRLGSLPIIGPGHKPTPLSSLASITPQITRAEFDRENQQQMIAMTADISGRSIGDINKDVERVLAAHPPPPGIRVEIGGQYAGQRQAFRSLLIVLFLAGVSVIAIMVVQFESFIEPFVIVVAAPISFVGALALLMITGTPLNVSSFMGLILLVGLIVKNGIILLDFTKLRMEREGVPLETAVREAARTRLRPILMTTLCTLFGLLPLALGLGAGSELQRPLALAVIGGLALSTPITLFVVPTVLVAVRGRDFKKPAPSA